MVDYSNRVRSPYAIAVLVVFMVGIGLGSTTALVLVETAGEYAWLLAGLGALAGLAVAGYASMRMNRARWATIVLFITGIPSGVLRGWARTGDPVPRIPSASGVVVTTFLAAACLVGSVATVLWMAGYYEFSKPIIERHKVTVWDMPASDRPDDDYYQAVCECEWRSKRYPQRDAASEERAFAAARGHSKRVASYIQFGNEVGS